MDRRPRHGTTHYGASAIRSIVLDQGLERSRSSIRMTVTVLRAFLRCTVSQGLCAPSLLHAVPPAVRRKFSIVPRTIPAGTIEDIIASCEAMTPVEIRDRAILLLLARMALRAGDVWQLRLSDIDWRARRLRLHGRESPRNQLPCRKTPEMRFLPTLRMRGLSSPRTGGSGGYRRRLPRCVLPPRSPVLSPVS